MERAVNPETGEVVFLVNNQWVKPDQMADNPKTGERAYLVGGRWEVMKNPLAKPAAPTVAPSDTPGVSDPMGMGGSEIMAAAAPAQPKRQSVLEGRQAPTPVPSPISLGVDPKFVASTNAYLDSLPQEQRASAIQQLQHAAGCTGKLPRRTKIRLLSSKLSAPRPARCSTRVWKPVPNG